MAFPEYPIPDNDRERVNELHRSTLLDDVSRPALDRLVKLAATVVNTPVSLLTLVDEDRQWLKARHGLDIDQTPRTQAFCTHTIMSDDPFIITDALLDSRFATNPLVTQAPFIRAYAGVAIKNSKGYRLGSICTIDHQAREFADNDIIILQELSSVANDLIASFEVAERARLAETRLTEAVEALPEGFVLYDADDRLVMCNDRYREIYQESSPVLQSGAKFEDLLRYGLEQGQFADAVGREEDWLAERLAAHQLPRSSIEQKLPGDRWLRIEERATKDGGKVGFRIDITEFKRQQRKLETLASVDDLTKLMNRRRFLEVVDIESKKSVRSGEPIALIILDIDHFKCINDTFGHAAGDAVLVALGNAMRTVLRPYDTFGRLGGEEFAVMIPGISLENSIKAAERLRRAFAAIELSLARGNVRFTASFGITFLEINAADSISDGFERGDQALYFAKQNGRNRIAICQLGEPPRIATPSEMTLRSGRAAIVADNDETPAI